MRPRSRFGDALSYRPAAIAIALFATIFGITTLRLLRETDGHFSYAMDDPYIHMAIARNLAVHGTWGLRPNEFAAASSAPLWTALLSGAFVVGGVRESLPLLLNLAFACACLVSLSRTLDHERIRAFPRFAVLAGVVFLTPLVPMVWLGMEHTLMLWIATTTAWTAARLANRDPAVSLGRVCILSALLVSTRYEGAFVVAGCALALAIHGRPRAAGALLLAGLTPVAVIGVWQLSHGWYFLPASILMKQTVLSLSSGMPMFEAMARNILSGQVPMVVMALAAAALWRVASAVRSTANEHLDPLLVIFLTATVLHIALARFGQLYRYESYLVALGVSAVGASLARASSRMVRRHDAPLVVSGLLVLIVVVFGTRTIQSHAQIAVTAGHIYRQQRQMAQFLGRYYNTDAVALNDIGAVSFFTDTRVDDLMGLASLEAAQSRRHNRFDAAAINAWLDRDHVPITIIYDAWFPPPQDFQSQWVHVARWETDDGGDTEGHVDFYARDSHAAETLAAHLREFGGSLPGRTRQQLLQ